MVTFTEEILRGKLHFLCSKGEVLAAISGKTEKLRNMDPSDSIWFLIKRDAASLQFLEIIIPTERRKPRRYLGQREILH